MLPRAPLRVAAAAADAAAAAAIPAAAGEDVKGEMLAPSIFNNNAFRLLATAATLGVAAKSSVYLPAQALSFVHLLAYGSWLVSELLDKLRQWLGSLPPALPLPAAFWHLLQGYS